MNTKPSKWLKYCLNNFVKHKKTALDLACGRGRNSLLLANYGFNVSSVDPPSIIMYLSPLAN